LITTARSGPHLPSADIPLCLLAQSTKWTSRVTSTPATTRLSSNSLSDLFSALQYHQQNNAIRFPASFGAFDAAHASTTPA
jgi:hypothetical protein